ncbi:MAG: trifunctional transcriptional activator/DNA repair protein Ada/methylated-DNA--[protein]-cysteine S-methyltransferase [Pseudomonadota bacterium]
MLFALPDDQTLYAALLARDAGFDGRAYVCVSTTGVFCRLTCPARKPKRENCTFLETAGACIEAGYRPCKRCRPLASATASDPAIATLLEALDARQGHRWVEADIAAMGFDPSTVRRSFKRHFGMTFLEMARQRRLREGFEVLSAGGRVVDAQVEAGFESPSAFRRAFAALLGQPPGALSRDGLLHADWIETPVGAMLAVGGPDGLHLLEFLGRKALPTELKRLWTFTKGRIGIGTTPANDQVRDELAQYFSGERATFETPLVLHGSPFTREVWQALLTIPAGETRSYAQIARQMGRPSATRAVARANGANQIAIIIPCHRVIGADGSLTGYGGGLWRKQKLIDVERAYRAQTGETSYASS